jgi:hypothetical protein
LANTGNVLRLATARPTILRPLAKFSCKQETFIGPNPLGWEIFLRWDRIFYT